MVGNGQCSWAQRQVWFPVRASMTSRGSCFARNGELKVHQGDQVSEGTLLALLGSTGHSGIEQRTYTRRFTGAER